MICLCLGRWPTPGLCVSWRCWHEARDDPATGTVKKDTCAQTASNEGLIGRWAQTTNYSVLRTDLSTLRPTSKPPLRTVGAALFGKLWRGKGGASVRFGCDQFEQGLQKGSNKGSNLVRRKDAGWPCW